MLKNTHLLLLGFCLITAGSKTLAEQDMKEASMPRDMSEFTCTDFDTKIQDCESYTCQTPSFLDPSQAMEWAIIEKKNNRCVISNTLSDVGLKDENGNPKPVTKTCEYNETGIAELSSLIGQLSAGYFSPSDAKDIQGSHNCTITSDGNPLKPTSYSNSNTANE